ncbi:cation:proton antiporter [Corynebacterium sp. UBA2622]|uniref:cation:proton antiporter n=1 Tax=Corynebacterium sp. UBA2622 TaxID=1946393 RepID=UPI0025C50366|nr:cation:proton antiporter [Corynebacterium sp. UBA2622]
MFVSIITACIVVMAACLLVGLAAVILTRDELSRVVMADLIFYTMVAIYLLWTLFHSSMISYEIAVLSGLVCGAIPTLSMARIISRGRR